MKKNKLIRVTTVPISLKTLLKGQQRFMSDYFEVLGVASAGSELDEVRENEGITVQALSMTRNISPWSDLVSLINMVLLFRKEKPLIVHSHTPKAGVIAMLAAYITRVPYRLHTVAGLPLMETSGFKRKLLNAVEQLTYSCATKVYPNSKGLHDFILSEQFCHPDKLKVLANGSSNGIDTAFFSKSHFTAIDLQSLKESVRIQSDDFVFIFVGRLVGDKGINELVTAFSQLTTFSHPEPVEGHNLKLLLVGDFEAELDPLFPETLELIQNHPAIINVGFQKDVRPFMAISTCLVFPSYREGFPNVVMQAGSMGLPCIVSNINGCNEIIVEGQNGTIIPVKKTAEIEGAMRKMIDDKVYYNQLKDNARPMIQSRYEQKVVWNALLEEYNMLIKN